MSSQRLAGKKALVSGAGRGIGRGCALELARAGADVVINDRRGSPDIARTREEIKRLGRDGIAIEADAFSRGGCEDMVARAIASAGRIDILVSNTALSIRRAFLDFTPDEFASVVDAILVGGFHLSQLVARHMAERRSGKIIFISSVHAPMPYAGSAAYNAAKAGLENMARTLAVELAAKRVNVNVIEPGWIDTPGEREHFGDEVIDGAGPSLPWGRLGRPADIAKAAVFLASDDADYITGTILRVDGGFTLRDCLSES